jgi:hypothetical protein
MCLLLVLVLPLSASPLRSKLGHSQWSSIEDIETHKRKKNAREARIIYILKSISRSTTVMYYFQDWNLES